MMIVCGTILEIFMFKVLSPMSGIKRTVDKLKKVVKAWVVQTVFMDEA